MISSKSLTVLLLCTCLTAIGAKAKTPPETMRLYQEGLYLQHSVGDLDKALAVYEKALSLVGKPNIDNKSNEIIKSLLSRQAECYQLLGQHPKMQTTIAALQKKERSQTINLGEARYFPPQSDVVFQIKISDLLMTPLIQQLKQAGKINLEINADELNNVLPIPSLEKIKKLTASLTLSADNEIPIENWLVQLEGNLQDLDFSHWPQEKIFDYLVYVVDLSDISKKQGLTSKFGVVQLDKNSLLAGEMQSLAWALAARSGQGPGLGSDSKLAKLAEQVPSNSTLWLIATPQRLLEQTMNSVEQNEFIEKLRSIDGFLVTSRIEKDLELNATAWAQDKDSAADIDKSIQGLISIARILVSNENKTIKDLLDSLKIKTNGQQINIQATVPEEFLTTSTGNFGKLKVNTLTPTNVYLDGKKVGRTPLTMDVPVGIHDVSLVDDNAETLESRKISIKRGETMTIYRAQKRTKRHRKVK
jgi:hypothetical protein